MKRFVIAAALALGVAGCQVQPEMEGRSSSPADYMGAGSKAMVNSAAAGATSPGVTESSQRAGESYYGAGKAPADSYYGNQAKLPPLEPW